MKIVFFKKFGGTCPPHIDTWVRPDYCKELQDVIFFLYIGEKLIT